MITIKLFLASSSELKGDRQEFEIFINRKNKDLVAKGVFLELVVWEDFLDAVSQTRLQDEYDKEISNCDIFVMLFWTKVGQYTKEEFETAFGQFKVTNKPSIFTYFKDADISTASANEEDLMSLWAFKKKLSALGHFFSVYKNVDELKYKFNRQLDELAGIKEGTAKHAPAGYQTAASIVRYSGKQRDRAHSQTQAIWRQLEQVLCQPGLNAPAGLHAFEYVLRPHTRTRDLTLEQKRILYGGVPRSNFRLSPPALVAWGLAFQRELVDTIYTGVLHDAGRFTSHTIIAHPGQGKTLSLAQLLVRFCDTPGFWTFWSFSCDVPFATEHGERCVHAYREVFQAAGVMPARIVFIFDDLHRRTDFGAIEEFHSWCEFLDDPSGPAISIICGCGQREVSLSAGNAFSLRLTAIDEDRLFHSLTETDPILARKIHSSLDELLGAFPARQIYKDDVQSFTDHIIQHCDPVPDFEPNWISDLNSETPLVRRLIPIVAVPQLLDLAVPEHLANAAAEFEYGEGPSPAMVLASSRLLSRGKASDEEDEDRWGGYVLRSPRYAKSVLGRLQEASLTETFAALVRHSFARSRSNFHSWLATDAEFVRLIFQRLARWEYNRLANVADGMQRVADGKRIANVLFSEFGEPIASLLKETLLHGGCEAHVGAGERSITRHGRRWLARDRAYD